MSEASTALDPQLLGILACPSDDHAPLTVSTARGRDVLVCTSCGRRYPVVDGIPVLLLTEAELPEPTSGTEAELAEPTSGTETELAEPTSGTETERPEPTIGTQAEPAVRVRAEPAGGRAGIAPGDPGGDRAGDG